MNDFIHEFVKSVKANYINVDEDLAIQLWCELVDELINEGYINDEDEMPFSSEYLEY